MPIYLIATLDTKGAEIAFVREDHEGVYSSLNREGVAEMIGFLEVKDNPDGRPFHVLANEAAARGEHYQVLYYWGRSYRTPRAGDDWKQCEVAKLRAYEAMDFPGSRQRARSELQWMMSTHPSPQVEALAREFQSAR